MSIEVMTAVWRNAEMRGAPLLVLLALADYANDQGVCWPSLMTLALKSRVSERQVRRILRSLERSGDIEVDVNGGPRGVNLYKVRGDMVSSQGDI